MESNGLSDHDLLMETREDVRWIRNHMAGYVSRKEFYGLMAIITTVVLGVVAVG